MITNTMNLKAEHKIKASHLERPAYIYIRQSTAKQVMHNQESQHYQRRLQERAEALGWPAESIQVIDSDLAQSGKESQQRSGFQELVSELSLGRIGIIFSYEVSRLARNNSDWYQVLDLAAMFDTLIADNDGIYYPQSYNDRLLLGLKGTMSEAELHLIKQRLEAGRMSQVKRGAYKQRLPTGLLRQADGTVVKDPDSQVQMIIQLVLSKFEELGSCGKVLRYLRKESILVPRRCIQPLQNEVLWKVASESAIYEMLSNPAYAGAFVYGRRQTMPIKHQLSRSKRGLVRKDISDWLHIEQNRYPAYISWQQYQKNQEKLKQNAMTFNNAKSTSQGAPRDGKALLQGLLLCSCCGHRLTTHYKSRSAHRYACYGLNRTIDTGTCLSVSGLSLDQAVEKAFFEALQPANLNALEALLKNQQSEHNQLTKQWQQRLQRAEYDTRLAQRQYQAVDPDNRLVAAELERRWEHSLRALQTTEEAFEAFQCRPLTQLSPDLKIQFQEISRHLPELWQSINNSHKKALLRSLIASIIVSKPQASQIELKIVWVSKHYSLLTIKAPCFQQIDMPNHEQLIQRLKCLWQEGFDDKYIAQKLSKEGFYSARLKSFQAATIQKLRLEHSYLSALERSRNAFIVEDCFTIKGLAQHLSVDYHWVLRRIKNHTIPPHLIHRHAQGGIYLIQQNATMIQQLKASIKRKSHT